MLSRIFTSLADSANTRRITFNIVSTRIVAWSVVAVALTASSAAAQDHGRVGVTMSYPSRVGVLWHLTDRLSVQPEIAARRTSSEFAYSLSFGFGFLGEPALGGTTTTRSSLTTWQISPGANLLVDLMTRDDVATYATVGWSYLHFSDTTVETTETTEVGVSVPPAGTERTTSSRRGYETRAAFGARYVPRRHFGLFGEVGVEYSENTSHDEWDTTSSDFTTRGVAGVVVYF